MIAPLPVPSGAPARAEPPGPGRALLEAEELAALRAAVGDLLEVAPGLEPRLAGAVRDTLAAPGSLWRAQLAWAVARAHGIEPPVAQALATGVEAFHTASLLFDDLPAMDDAATRRGRPCVHRSHGEAAAMLAALAFVHRGYARIWRALERAPALRRRDGERLVESCLGLDGILDGQARDVHPPPGAHGWRSAARVAAGKTVPLLRLALVLPALVGGAPAARRLRFERLASAWGLAYQILDDLGDLAGAVEGSDLERGRPNFAAALGREGATARLLAELGRADAVATALATELPALTGPFGRLSGLFESQRRTVSR